MNDAKENDDGSCLGYIVDIYDDESVDPGCTYLGHNFAEPLPYFIILLDTHVL
jgi:hypothetical protein